MSDVVEIWKDIIDYEGRYMVSNLGRIKSLLRGEYILQPNNSRGYSSISLYSLGNSSPQSVLIHRLVAQHFLENWDPDLTVDHINYIKNDNRACNLRMVSGAKNLSNKNKTLSRYSSLYHGVQKKRGKWLSCFVYKGDEYIAGTFNNQFTAALMRDKYIINKGWQDSFQLNFELDFLI